MTSIEDRLHQASELGQAAFMTSVAAGEVGQWAVIAAELPVMAERLGRGRVGKALTRLRRATRSATTQAERAHREQERLTALLPATVAALAAHDHAPAAAIERFEKSHGRAGSRFVAALVAIEAAARWGAGIAAFHEPTDLPSGEVIWYRSRGLLSRVVLDPERPVDLTVDDDASLEAYLAGFIAHLAAHGPADGAITVRDRPARYVRVRLSEPEGMCVEVSSDRSLPVGERYKRDALQNLEEMGFTQEVPGGSWRCEIEGNSASHIARLLREVLTHVHGVSPGTELRIQGQSALPEIAVDDDDSLIDVADDASVLIPDQPSVDGLAQALAARLREWATIVGLDSLEVTIGHPDPDWPYPARIGPAPGGGLEVEVMSNACIEDAECWLDEEELSRLRALGWADPTAPAVGHTIIFDASTSVEVACWHLMITLIAIYGLDATEPVVAMVWPTCADQADRP